jgi:hypothetical protein
MTIELNNKQKNPENNFSLNLLIPSREASMRRNLRKAASRLAKLQIKK